MQTSRQELIRILKAVEPGISSKEVLACTESFLFSGDRVCTYNDFVSVSHKLPEGLKLTGAVKSDELLKLLGKITGDTVDIVMADAELQIGTAKSKAGIVRESEVPAYIESIGEPEEWTPISREVLEAIAFCQFSCSSDLSHPLLTNVCVRKNRVMSCDNKRATSVLFENDVTEHDLLIPSNVVTLLFHHAPVAYGMTNGWCCMKNADDAVFSFRMVEGAYPDIVRVLNVTGTQLEMPAELADGVDRAEAVIDAKDRNPFVTISANKGVVLLESRGPNGWFKERYKTPFTGNVKFAISPTFLADALKHHSMFTVGERSLKIESSNFVHVITLMAEAK